jgi:osmotically inducible protein OsmC
MASDSRAEATWQGTLFEGSGTIASGPLAGEHLTWNARAEGGGTSPEDMIAAAHASCFAMALSNVLAKAGTPAEELNTSATATFVPGEGITKIALTVRGRVPGADEASFRAAAEDAKATCPVSKALAGVPEVTLETSFDG